MAIGANGGSQLNLILFEVGIITTMDGQSQARTVAVHPLLVVPSASTLKDSTRSTVQQNAYGGLLVLGGRQLAHLSYTGTFGVMERALGPYFGDGATRAKRFYNEVVRLAECLRLNDVAQYIDTVTGSIGIRQRALNFNPAVDVFFVNLYDFLHNFFGQVLIDDYSINRTSDRGGATGLFTYQMSVSEVGPLVAGTTAGAVLDPIIRVGGRWRDINRQLAALDATALAEMRVSAAAIPVTLVADSIQVLADKAAGAAQLLSGARRYRTDSNAIALNGMMGQVRETITSIRQARDSIRAVGRADYVPPQGQVKFFTQQNVPTTALDRFDQLRQLCDTEDAARFQLVAGCFYGMSRETYQQYVESNGEGSGPNGVMKTYTVTSFDTSSSIATATGVAWSAIVAANGLTSDEALTAGTVLQIPGASVVARQTVVAGLPVFGSHAGSAVLGSDVLAAGTVSPTSGDLDVVVGPACLAQGIDILLDMASDNETSLMGTVASIPQAYTQLLTARYRSLLTKDPRIVSVDSVKIERNSTGTGYIVTPQVTAITGQQMSEGNRL